MRLYIFFRDGFGDIMTPDMEFLSVSQHHPYTYIPTYATPAP